MRIPPVVARRWLSGAIGECFATYRSRSSPTRTACAVVDNALDQCRQVAATESGTFVPATLDEHGYT
jgi:hypothetical protein